MQENLRKKLQNRLRRAEGQVRGISSMIDRGENYRKIITQLMAVKSAMNSIENILLESELEDRLSETNNKDLQDEIMKIFISRK